MSNWKKAGMLAVLTAVLSGVCFAAEDRVASVTVNGLSGDDLLAAQRVIKTHAGDLYLPRALQDDVTALLGLPFVISAKAKQSTTPDGVEVIYEVSARGRLENVRFEGNRKFKRKKLLRVGEIQNLKHYDLARLVEARQLIIDRYKSSGYLYATVEFDTQADGSVLFTINEGRRVKVAKVLFTGNTALVDKALAKEVQTKTRKFLFFPVRLNENALEEDRLRVQDLFRNAGYLDATVDAAIRLTRNGKGLIITFAISEGPLYTVDSIAIEGNSVIETRELLSLLKMTRGTPFSSVRAGADMSEMRRAYGRIGHIDASVTPETVFAETESEVAVTYHIREGEVIFISAIEIFGNDKTRDNVVRRELEFAPGEKFNTDRIESSTANLNRLGHFSTADIAPGQYPPGALHRPVIVTVEDKPTGQFNVGLGISTNAGIIGNFSFTQQNFDYATPPRSWRDIVDGRAWAGAGQRLELNAQPGTDVSQFRFAYRDPRFNDTLYSFGLGGHLWERDWDTYNEKRSGGEISVGKQFSKNAFWDVGFAADTVKVGGFSDGFYEDIKNINYIPGTRNPRLFYQEGVDPEWRDPLVVSPAFEELSRTKAMGKSQVNTLSLTVGHDTRNILRRPTDGHRITGKVEASSDALGSEFDFLRFRFDGSWYKTLYTDKLDRPFVLSLRSGVGYLLPRHSGEVPLYERFFAGGSTSLRGFENRGVGPRDLDTALGGELLVLGGVQYEYPLVGDNFRGVVFWDAGAVTEDAADLDLNNIRHSVGVGVRFQFPPPLNFPLALDLGFAVEDEASDETQVFSFSMGGAL